MQQGNIDEYVAKFERLIREAGYDRDTPLTIELFTNGLPNALYETVYTMDDPQTYERWKSAVLERQKQYIHIQARKRLDGYKPANPRPQNFTPRKPQDPNAMDTSPGRTRARLAGSEDGLFSNHPGPPPYKPRGGFLQRRAQENRDHRGVTCYQCQQRGHLSYDCPQRNKNKGQQSGARVARNDTEDGQTVQVARSQTAREEASEWLEGASRMTDDAKDLVLQDLFQKADFQDA